MFFRKVKKQVSKIKPYKQMLSDVIFQASPLLSNVDVTSLQSWT